MWTALGCRRKIDKPTGGSIAIMCPTVYAAHMPLAKMGSAIQPQTCLRPQANRVNISYRDEAGEELIVPPGDLASEGN
jgi:hypothetical protein